MDILSHAIATATRAHEGQAYGDGPYILHPLRVMLRVMEETADPEMGAAAVLHDTPEDTDITLEILRELGFSPRTVDAVDGMTKRAGETYMARMARAAEHADSRLIKRYDLKDNLANDPGEKLRKRYYRALRIIMAAELLAGQGDPRRLTDAENHAKHEMYSS